MKTPILGVYLGMDSTTINIIGLIFDVLGVAGLFIYGLPAKHNQDGVVVKVMEGNADKKPFERLVIKSRVSLALIIIGFGLQILSTTHISKNISCPETYEDTSEYYYCECCCCNCDHE